MTLVEVRRMVPDTPLRRGDRGVLLKLIKNTSIGTEVFSVDVAGTNYTLLREDFDFIGEVVLVGTGRQNLKRPGELT